MPLQRTSILAADDVLASPFLGPNKLGIAIVVDPSIFSTGEVDANGYLKPGVPLTRAGALIAAAGAVYGCVAEAVKIAKSSSQTDRDAAPNIEVAVYVECFVNRAVLEDILGRVLTAAEIAGFDLAGSQCKLIA